MEKRGLVVMKENLESIFQQVFNVIQSGGTQPVIQGILKIKGSLVIVIKAAAFIMEALEAVKEKEINETLSRFMVFLTTLMMYSCLN